MLEINNLTNFKVDEKSFSHIAKIVLSGENRLIETLSLALVSKEEIKKLNKKFRKKDKATDVLSFSAGAPAESVWGWEDKNYLGEIIICPEVVGEMKENITQVFIHGALHLLGYDHEASKEQADKMEAKEKFYFSKL